MRTRIRRAADLAIRIATTPAHVSLAVGCRYRGGRCAGLALIAALAGCETGAAAPPPATSAVPAGTQYIVGVDISGSRNASQLAEGQVLLDRVIGRLANGDRLVLLETYQVNDTGARQWEDSLRAARTPGKPNGTDQKHVAQFQGTARAVAASFFDAERSQQVRSTDLLATLARAADYARAARGRRTTVLLLSDMLNSTPELDMERAGGVPGAAWVARRKAEGRLPDLRRVCVVVAGADVTSKRGAAARDFWRAYFAATGADFDADRYRNMIASAGQVACG